MTVVSPIQLVFDTNRTAMGRIINRSIKASKHAAYWAFLIDPPSPTTAIWKLSPLMYAWGNVKATWNRPVCGSC